MPNCPECGANATAGFTFCTMCKARFGLPGEPGAIATWWTSENIDARKKLNKQMGKELNKLGKKHSRMSAEQMQIPVMQLQDAMGLEVTQFQMISNTMKVRHDTVRSAINNLR
jgi:hypothetical protein